MQLQGDGEDSKGFNSTGLRPSAAHRNPDTVRRSPFISSASSSSKWWSPLFGWSSDPDYIDSNSSKIAYNQDDSPPEKVKTDLDPARSKLFPGGFTEEKARRLRMMTTGTETFHDVMYHSAIASRLASDFSRSNDL